MLKDQMLDALEEAFPRELTIRQLGRRTCNRSGGVKGYDSLQHSISLRFGTYGNEKHKNVKIRKRGRINTYVFVPDAIKAMPRPVYRTATINFKLDLIERNPGVSEHLLKKFAFDFWDKVEVDP